MQAAPASRARFWLAHRTAAGSMSVAYSSISCKVEARASESAPEPQQSSTTTGRHGVTRRDCRNRSSVRRRGTNTPGLTAIRIPANSAHPTMCSKGVPATRCWTICSSSSRVRALVSSTAASSSANTQPAIRSLLISDAPSGGSRSGRSVVLLAVGEELLKFGGNLLRARHPVRTLSLQGVVLLLQRCHEFLNLRRGRHLLRNVGKVAGRRLLQGLQGQCQTSRLVQGASESQRGLGEGCLGEVVRYVCRETHSLAIQLTKPE